LNRPERQGSAQIITEIENASIGENAATGLTWRRLGRINVLVVQIILARLGQEAGIVLIAQKVRERK